MISPDCQQTVTGLWGRGDMGVRNEGETMLDSCADIAACLDVLIPLVCLVLFVWVVVRER